MSTGKADGVIDLNLPFLGTLGDLFPKTAVGTVNSTSLEMAVLEWQRT